MLAAIPWLHAATKNLPNTPAERDVQRQQLTWEHLAHGKAVAFVTPNVNTSRDPVLAALAVGPGEGDLLAEPTRRGLPVGQPLVRLSDLSSQARKGYDALITFARDPYALCQFTKRRWDSWWCRMLGAAKSVAPYRDGVAANTGFPGDDGVGSLGGGVPGPHVSGPWHGAVRDALPRPLIVVVGGGECTKMGPPFGATVQTSPCRVLRQGADVSKPREEQRIAKETTTKRQRIDNEAAD